MAKSEVVRALADQTIKRSQEARASLSPFEVHFLGRQGVSDPGVHFKNYINMISNRIITHYDDCAFLLESGRIPAACVLARCILETYAVGEFAAHEIVKAYNNGGLDKAGSVVMAYINSSRFKVEEQKRLKEGKLKLDDYHFTAEAKSRMQREEAVSKHILNAMRHLYAREMSVTGDKESRFELIYEQLSEWVHPSQTSLFHAFSPETWQIETSVGQISFWDGARNACAHGMHCITALSELRETMNDVADQLSTAHEASR